MCRPFLGSWVLPSRTAVSTLALLTLSSCTTRFGVQTLRKTLKSKILLGLSYVSPCFTLVLFISRWFWFWFFSNWPLLDSQSFQLGFHKNNSLCSEISLVSITKGHKCTASTNGLSEFKDERRRRDACGEGGVQVAW